MDDAQLVELLQDQLAAEREAHAETRRILATIASHVDHDPELERRRKERKQKLAKLTERQIEVVRTVAGQHTLSAAAERLYLSEHTVNNHLRQAKRRVGVRTRRELYMLCA